jgi:hypothetical protein
MVNLGAGRRLHIVLIPGFAGFDALGQLEYYSGVTRQFRKWKSSGRRHVVLHYFDNFPTASVNTRAGRLGRYLAKRIVRGEFLQEDVLALVGHSTGGLDIRRLLFDLARSPDEIIGVDGSEGVVARQILEMISRLVFLSVPQWGTNIAEWVRDNLLGRAVVVAELRASVAASQIPLLNRVQDWVSGGAAAILNLDLLHAVRDALNEAEAKTSGDPSRVAMAHEAASQLELWLRHIASDFRAIDDLRPPGAAESGDPVKSPAHFTDAEREWELAKWKEHGFCTRSYATIGKRPFRFEAGKAAPRWDFLKPWTWPECTESASEGRGSDLVYRYCYRACAGGSFTCPEPAGVPPAKPFGPAHQRRIEVWDNDGIVNTASMLWPDGEKTLLVECDHMDIVGHYSRVEAGGDGTGRRYRAYDLLSSASEFDAPAFARVWNDLFDFCHAQ